MPRFSRILFDLDLGLFVIFPLAFSSSLLSKVAKQPVDFQFSANAYE